jgi:hypothetical protein
MLRLILPIFEKYAIFLENAMWLCTQIENKRRMYGKGKNKKTAYAGKAGQKQYKILINSNINEVFFYF